jgi:hypothetical protein
VSSWRAPKIRINFHSEQQHRQARRIRDIVLDSDLENLKEELELNEDLVNIEIGRGNTLLHFACYENVDDCIAKWLLAKGANMEVTNYDDDKPIGNNKITKSHLYQSFKLTTFYFETDIACSKGGNRDAMLVLMHNSFTVMDMEDDFDSEEIYSYKCRNSNSRDSSPATSRDSCIAKIVLDIAKIVHIPDRVTGVKTVWIPSTRTQMMKRATKQHEEFRRVYASKEITLMQLDSTIV